MVTRLANQEELSVVGPLERLVVGAVVSEVVSRALSRAVSRTVSRAVSGAVTGVEAGAVADVVPAAMSVDGAESLELLV